MTDHERQQNILSRQIKGLTWGMVVTLVTAFGGSAYWVVKSYADVRISFALQLEINKQQAQKNNELSAYILKNTNSLDAHTGRLEELEKAQERINATQQYMLKDFTTYMHIQNRKK